MHAPLSLYFSAACSFFVAEQLVSVEATRSASAAYSLFRRLLPRQYQTRSSLRRSPARRILYAGLPGPVTSQDRPDFKCACWHFAWSKASADVLTKKTLLHVPRWGRVRLELRCQVLACICQLAFRLSGLYTKQVGVQSMKVHLFSRVKPFP